MLAVMADRSVDESRRDRMAIAAAPFVHPRVGDGHGKKDAAKESAKAAGKGRFAAAVAPPKLIAANGKVIGG